MMKILMTIFLVILAFNALVILAIAGILILDHAKSRRKEAKHDAQPKTL
jgi:hypothetical protein